VPRLIAARARPVARKPEVTPMRTLVLTALAVALAAWYAGQRSRQLAPEDAREAVERWEGEGGMVSTPGE